MLRGNNSSKKVVHLENSIERTISRMKEIRKTNATTTNRSRLSNAYTTNMNEDLSLGEIKLTRSEFKSKDFLLRTEKKLGNSVNLKGIERSITKLHDHS